MKNSEERPGGADFVAVSWNLHKGRSPLGFQAWSAMRRWVQSMPADAYFLQEAMARRMHANIAPPGFGEPRDDVPEDLWHCQATDIATAAKLQLALGQNVFKRSSRHGNAILSPHPLDLGGRWDISAHRFERRGLLVARTTVAQRVVTLLCAHLALTRAARQRQMQWIAHWITREAPQGPLILAGDLNDWKNDSAPIFGEIGLIEVASSLGLQARTFPAFSPAFSLDKIYTRGFTPLDFSVPNSNMAWLSDHLPYIARLRLE